MAEKSSSKINGTSVAIIAQMTSPFSTRLPRYSGERPTISPAMKTVSSTYISIP